jgi:hypothetical protein
MEILWIAVLQVFSLLVAFSVGVSIYMVLFHPFKEERTLSMHLSAS